MKTVAVSDIIRVAADVCLYDGYSYIPYMSVKYSCNAILGLLTDLDMREHVVKDIIFDAMKACGMSDPHGAHFHEFDEPIDKQSARYIWLMFLAEYLDGVIVNVTYTQYRMLNSLRKKYHVTN